APSFDNLGKLAQLYQCSVSDLLVDLPNYRDHDDAHHAESTANGTSGAPGGELVVAHQADDLLRDFLSQYDADSRSRLSPFVLPGGAASLAARLQAVNVDELAQVIVMWMQQLTLSVSRRDLLSKLSAALTVAAAAPVLDLLDPDEHEHVARGIQAPSGFDEPTLRYCEGMVNSLRRQDNVLGPQLTLHSAMGHRHIAQRLAKDAPSTFQQRATSAYANLTQFIGWLCFNMGDYRSAQHYYDDARSAAHDAQNVELVTYVLCSMSHLATWQGKPRVGIDHAVAAAVWAKQADSPLAQAYAAEVAVKAYIADSQPDKFRETLDHEYAALTAARPDVPTASWWYFYDESCYWRAVGECALKLQQPEAATHALDKSLTLVDPAHLHNNAFRLLFRAEARIQQAAIGEACSIIGDVARRTAVGRSQRIAQRIKSVRGLLAPWERTKPVRELDKQLVAYRPAFGNGSANGGYLR
ncbi:MAG: hypothetical protein ACRDT0_22460, partial [Pseudonocardiaceae bacterium]